MPGCGAASIFRVVTCVNIAVPHLPQLLFEYMSNDLNDKRINTKKMLKLPFQQILRAHAKPDVDYNRFDHILNNYFENDTTLYVIDFIYNICENPFVINYIYYHDFFFVLA